MPRALLVALLLAAVPASAQELAPPVSGGGYPTALIERPLTLPKGTLEVRGALSYAAVDFGPPLGTLDSTALGFGAGYGVTDQLEVRLATSLTLDPEFEWSQSLGLGGAFGVLDTDKLDVAATLDTALHLCDGCDVVNGMTLGVSGRLVLLPNLWVFGGQGLIPINFDPSYVDLDVNVGLGFQATPQLALTLDTQLFSVGLVGDGNESTSLGDFVPLGVRALFAVNRQLDVYAAASFPTLEHASDFYAVSLGAAIRVGQ